MFIRTKQFAHALVLGQERVLQTKNYPIPFNRVIRKTVPIPTGTSQIIFDNVYDGKLPDLVTLAMVSDRNMGGVYQTRPFHFQNFGAFYLFMQANGEQIPRFANQPNSAGRDYIRSYFVVLEALAFDIGPNCWDLTPEEWAHGYNIYAFKITPGPIGTVRCPARFCAVRLEIKVSNQTPDNVSVLMLSKHCADIQIDKSKNIIPIN